MSVVGQQRRLQQWACRSGLPSTSEMAGRRPQGREGPDAEVMSLDWIAPFQCAPYNQERYEHDDQDDKINGNRPLLVRQVTRR